MIQQSGFPFARPFSIFTPFALKTQTVLAPTFTVNLPTIDDLKAPAKNKMGLFKIDNKQTKSSMWIFYFARIRKNIPKKIEIF